MEKKNNVILITGANGFLGSTITKKLLLSGSKLILLIRASGGNENIFEDFIQNNHKPANGHNGIDELIHYRFLNSNIEIIKGDITSDNLNLDQDMYDRLCYEVDEVFHCAAATHFEKQRADELMLVNVGGTENILQFANSGKKKRFHHVSTAYVVGKGNSIYYEKKVDKEPLFNNEYERSKYIAEQLVLNYAEQNAIPYTIYRPSIIVGDSKTGHTRKYDNLYLFAKVVSNIKNIYSNRHKENLNELVNKSSDNGRKKMRVPGDPNASVNLVPIDYVADAIVEISEKKEAVGRIFHIVNPKPPILGELRDSFVSILGIKGINLSIKGEIEDKNLNTIERLFLRQTKTYYPYLFSGLRFDCTNTLKALKGTGISCPIIDHDLLKLLINYAILHKWGERKPTALQEVETC